MARCVHCGDSKKALCETAEACRRAERIAANIRAKGSDAVSVRDAVHEACHAIEWNLKGSWSRGTIERKNPWKRTPALGIRDEIMARAVEALVIKTLGLAYDQDKWILMMVMETLKFDRIALPSHEWCKDAILARMATPAAKKLADDIIARFDVEPQVKRIRKKKVLTPAQDLVS